MVFGLFRQRSTGGSSSGSSENAETGDPSEMRLTSQQTLRNDSAAEQTLRNDSAEGHIAGDLTPERRSALSTELPNTSAASLRKPAQPVAVTNGHPPGPLIGRIYNLNYYISLKLNYSRL